MKNFALNALAVLALTSAAQAANSPYSRYVPANDNTRGTGGVYTGSQFDIAVSLDFATVPYPDLAGRAFYEQALIKANQAVYEATNGAHSFRNIRVFKNAEFATSADVIWFDTLGTPNADPGAFGGPGAIRMYRRNDVGGALYSADRIGVELAKEWGTYAYTVFWEGKKTGGPNVSNPNTTPWLARRTDGAIYPSIMNIPTYGLVAGSCVANPNLAASAQKGLCWLNFSNPFAYSNSLSTAVAQNRYYASDVWTTLVRNPALDPPLANGVVRWPRVKYNELVPVAPPINTLPVIGGVAPEPTILWMEDSIDASIVMDRSGSMVFDEGVDAPWKFDDAKIGAAILIATAPPYLASISLVSFAGTATVDAPLTQLVDEDDYLDLIDIELGLEAGNATAIGNGAQLGVEQVLGGSASAKVVFLLSDGIDNSSTVDPLEVAYNAGLANVPIYTLAYGDGADFDLLDEMSYLSGAYGCGCRPAVGDSSVQEAFIRANQLATDGLDLVTDSVTLGSGRSSSMTFPFLTDSTINSIRVMASYPGAAGSVDIQLVSPTGERFSPTSCNQLTSSAICAFEAPNTVSGDWRLELTSNSDEPIRVTASATGRSIHTRYSLEASAYPSKDITYPQPAVIFARVTRELPVAGVEIETTVTAPDGSQFTLPMHDDGVAPDMLADDGRFSAYLNYTMDGDYKVALTATNEGLDASLTAAGLYDQESEYYEGGPGTPITERFIRTASTKVHVTGVVPDDYKNTVSELPGNAVALSPNGISGDPNGAGLVGRLELGSDKDVFPIGAGADANDFVRVYEVIGEGSLRLTMLNAAGAIIGSTVHNYGGNGDNGYLSVRFGDAIPSYVVVDSPSGTTLGYRVAVSTGASTPQEIGSRLLEIDLTQNQDGWTFGNPAPFATATGTKGSAGVGINTADNNNTFAYFDSPIVSIDGVRRSPGDFALASATKLGATSMFRLTATVTGDATSPANAPAFRLRTSSDTFFRSDLIAVDSGNDGLIAPSDAPRQYQLLFAQPFDKDSSLFRASLDVIGANPQDDAIAATNLERLQIESLSTTALANGETLLDLDFTTDTHGWTSRSAGGALKAPQFTQNGSGLQVGGNSTQAGETVFGYWGSPESDNSVVLQPGRVYKVTAQVFLGDTASDSIYESPAFRVRVNDSTLRFSAYTNFESTAADKSLYAGERVLYFQVPEELAGTTPLISLDYLYTPTSGNNVTRSLSLRKLTLESFPIE